jgi:hypothetical protein
VTAAFTPWFVHSATPWTDALRGFNLLAAVVIVFGVLRAAIGRKVYGPYRAILLGVLFLGMAGLASPLRMGQPATLGIWPFSAALYCCVYGVWHIRIDRARGVRGRPVPEHDDDQSPTGKRRR